MNVSWSPDVIYLDVVVWVLLLMCRPCRAVGGDAGHHAEECGGYKVSAVHSNGAETPGSAVHSLNPGELPRGRKAAPERTICSGNPACILS